MQEDGRDAKVCVFADSGHMNVELLVEPPQGGGRDVTMEDLQAALSRKGVVFGIQEDVLRQLALPIYGQRMAAARGLPAQDGQDGVCRELFSRQVEKRHEEREDGSVDYRELGLVRDVKEGTVICEVTPPTDGVDGANTKGQAIKAKSGAKAPPPVGENITLAEDGTRAVAAVAGNLVFRNGRFAIDTVVRVQDVDYEVGNVTFSGDVVVNGDMHDGFEIHAGGNVTLRGQVGGVVVQARNITIEKGINGTGKALLEASDTVKAGFVENCSLRVGEKLVAQSLINSQVECEGEVDVTSGKGIICGGSVTSFGSVKAKRVGNEYNTPTVITLGITPKLMKERKRLTDQIEDVGRHIEEMHKNARYIEELVAEGRPIPTERVQMLKRTQMTLPITERKKAHLEAALAELEGKIAGVAGATLTAQVIYPPTKVTVGNVWGNLSDTRHNCRVYKNEQGELVFGSA